MYYDLLIYMMMVSSQIFYPPGLKNRNGDYVMVVDVKLLIMLTFVKQNVNQMVNINFCIL